MELTITVIIVVITSLVSLAALSNQQLTDKLIFYPVAVSKNHQWYRFFTCGLIHADFGHLFFNMFALYLFGKGVELQFERLFGSDGRWMYLIMYVSALFISLLPTFARHRNDYYYRSLGASGAVSAVMFAGLLLAPTVGVMIFPIPIAIPGFIFAPLYLIISAYLDRKGNTNINHSAHIWGALFGLAFVLIASRTVGYPVLQNMVEDIRRYMS